MSEIKYTTDGKKVIVVGKLNSNETIVQEIFIANSGAEIPSGENFVVKSLHDTPVESWKAKSLREDEARYYKEKAYWEKEIESLSKIKRMKSDDLKAHIESVGEHLKSVSPESFETICKVLGGVYRFAVHQEWGGYKIENIEESTFFSNEYGVKLLSLFGRYNGDMKFRVNSYSDGSGGWSDIVFFDTLDSAKNHVKGLIESKKSISDSDIKTAEKYGFEISKEKVKEYWQAQASVIEKRIKEMEDSVKKLKEDLQDILKNSVSL